MPCLPRNRKLQGMNRESRTQTREQVALPVTVGKGKQGVTQDVSASGLFFLTDSAQRVGSQVAIEIQLDTPSGPMKLEATGEILRIEPRGGQTGVAVKLVESRLVPVA